MKQYLRVITYLFPLFLVGIFFVILAVDAQQATVNADVKISVCGNNIAEGGEECDNSDFAGQACTNFGFDTGNLSCEVDCTISVANCADNPPDNSGGGGGGGGSAPPPPQTSVIFSGKAYPLSSVSILRDGQLAITTIAGPNADFNVSLSGLSNGTYNFAVYSEDQNANRSSLFTFSVYVTIGSSTEISGIFLAPTIATDKSEVRYGDDIAIFGQSVPNSTVTINVNSDNEFFRYVTADASGAYLNYFDTSVLERGNHSTRSKSRSGEEVSTYGQSVAFVVGNNNVDQVDDDASCTSLTGDLSCDGRVNIVDFSIAAFWYQRSNPNPASDLNHDGIVNIIDFSIMAFYWTG